MHHVLLVFLFHTLFQLRLGIKQSSVSVDDFFKENIVQNIAALLGIDKSRIRVMDVISAGGRRRRNIDDDNVLITVC